LSLRLLKDKTAIAMKYWEVIADKLSAAGFS
jgi:hypothetical protein